MNNLNINYEETINLGINVTNKGEEIDEIVLKIKNVIEELSISWQGEDASRFLNNLNEQLDDMQKLSIVINELGQLIQKTASDYKQVSLNNMNF